MEKSYTSQQQNVNISMSKHEENNLLPKVGDINIYHMGSNINHSQIFTATNPIKLL